MTQGGNKLCSRPGAFVREKGERNRTRASGICSAECGSSVLTEKWREVRESIIHEGGKNKDSEGEEM